MSNKFVITPANGTTPASVVQTTAGFSDVVTTAFASDEFVDGGYKYLQLGIAFLGGMITQNKRLTGSYNPFK